MSGSPYVGQAGLEFTTSCLSLVNIWNYMPAPTYMALVTLKKKENSFGMVIYANLSNLYQKYSRVQNTREQ